MWQKKKESHATAVFFLFPSRHFPTEDTLPSPNKSYAYFLGKNIFTKNANYKTIMIENKQRERSFPKFPSLFRFCYFPPFFANFFGSWQDPPFPLPPLYLRERFKGSIRLFLLCSNAFLHPEEGAAMLFCPPSLRIPIPLFACLGEREEISIASKICILSST